MENTYLAHHGIKGQKWGVRRFQNEDGSLTPAGERCQKRENKRNIKTLDTYFNKTSVGQQHLGVMATAASLSRVNEKYYDSVRKYINDGVLYVEAHTKKNYKEGSLDIYISDPNDPIFRTKIKDGKEFVYEWVNDADRINYEKWVSYTDQRAK